MIKNIINFIGINLHNFMNYMGRYRLINNRSDDAPYLERYYIFLKNRKNFPFNIFIHKFVNSDPDDLHDHPWPYAAMPLWPGYWEYTIYGKFWRGPFSIRYAPSETLHRIELKGDYCWTIFIPGRKIRNWGFVTDDGWVKNEEYLTKKKSI
jgi:hypothetical protein